MKNNKASFKSFRKKVISKEGVDAISPGIRHGETLIPNGSSNATIELPETKETFTYEIINSDSMTGDIKVAATEGSLKGLVLNSDGGVLNIAPVPVDCKQIQFKSTMTDGSYIHTLSDGSDWFLWSFGFGNGLGVSTSTYIRGNAGLVGGGSDTPFESITPGPTYAPVIITSRVITVEYPGGVATHDISFSGTAEPGSTLKIFDISNALIGTVNPVANDGSWNFSVSGLINGDHEYTFKAFVEGSFIRQSASWNKTFNGGLISFSCSQIQVEVGTTSPNFATEPVIYHQDSDGVQTSIANTTVVSTTYSDSDAAGTTFDVVFEFTYDSVTYQRTVTGNTIVNLVQPTPPTISTVGGNVSGAPISVTIADISGTALPNADVIVWVDDSSTSTSVTADGTGQWTILYYDFGFTNNQTIILYAQQQTVNGTRWSNNSTKFDVVYEQNVLAVPAVTDIDGLNSGGFTNTSDPLTINGTGVVGATVTVASAGSTLTTSPSTITVDSNGDWTAALPNMTDETLHTITAQQSKAGFTQSQQSAGFIINVDRTPPVLATVLDTVLYLPNFADTLPTATDSFSSVVVTAAYSPALVGAEDDYSATYTATDQAGNTATGSRTITITTETIVPVISSAVDNEDGTATITGTVTGTYADNLEVQIVIDDVDNGIPLTVVNGAFEVIITLSDGTYSVEAKTKNSADEFSDLATAVSVTVTGTTLVNFIEELQSAEDNISNPSRVRIQSGVYERFVSGGSGHTYVDLDADGIFSYTNGIRTNTETTLSFWLKFDETPGTGPNILGWTEGNLQSGTNDFGIRVGRSTSSARIQFVPVIGDLGIGSNYATWNINPAGNGPAYSDVGTSWNHYALVYKYNGSSYDLKIYINGVVVGKNLNNSFKINKNASQSRFGIGCGRTGISSESVITLSDDRKQSSIDSIQIGDGVALLDSQVAAIYNQSDRLMTIAEAAAIPDSQPTLSVLREISLDGAEDDSNLSLNGNAVVTDGELVLDGNGDFATLNTSVDDWNLRDANGNAEDTTFEVWFNPTRLPSASDPSNNGGMRYGLLAKNVNNAQNGWLIALDNDTSDTANLVNGGIQLTLHDTSIQHIRIPVPGGLSGDSSGPGVTLNTWHHVAVVLPASGPGRIYYDGQEISDPTNGITIGQRPSYAAHDLRFGSYQVQNLDQNFFAGKIDGAIVTKSVLSSSEILQKYQTGKSVQIANGDTIIINAGDSFNYSATSSDTEDGLLTPTLVDDGGLDVNTPDTYTIQHSVTDSANQTVAHSFDVVVRALSSYIEDLSNFTLFGNSTLANVAGNFIYNHGTTGTGNYATGKWSDGLTHDGSGFSYTSYTLSFWVKFNTLPANSQDVFIFSARDSSHNGLEFIMDTTTGGSKSLQVYHSDVGNNNVTRQLTDVLTSSESITQFQNVWINFVAVVSNGDANLNVYINESLRRSGQSTGYSDTRTNGAKYVNDDADANSTFTIGDRWDGSNDHTTDIEIDSIQIAENVILTEAQANAIANDTTRQMTIAAAALPNYIEQTAAMFGDAAYTSCTLSLDGTGDYATVSSGFRYEDLLSISLWFKTSASGDQRIISSHIVQAGHNGFFVRLNNNAFEYRTPDQGSGVSGGPSGLNDGAWHHIVVTWDGNSRKLYVDNVLIHNHNAGSNATGYIAGEDLYIGGAHRQTADDVVGFFNGEIARVEVLNEVLDAAEVTTRFNDGNGAC